MILKKKFKTETKKNWKQIDYENIDISTICSEDEEFFKIDESQNFQNVLNKTKNTNIFTTKNINWAIDQYKHKTIIETTKRKFKTPYSGSTKKIKINDRSKRSTKADKSIISNLNAKNTIDYIIDQMNKVFENDASQEKSVSSINQTLNDMINTFEKMKMRKVIDNEQKVRELIRQSWAMIFFIRQQNLHNFILTAVMHNKIERIQQIMNDVFEKSTSSVKELIKKKTQRSAELHVIKTNVKHIF